MHAILLGIVCTATFSFSNTITLSKDSLKVYANTMSSFRDQITIKNSSEDTIALDSAYLLFDTFDTTGMSSSLPPNDTFECFWIDQINERDFSWYLHEIDANTFKLTKKYFSPDSAKQLRCSPNDSCDLFDFQIGIFLVSAHYPIYPKYVKGSLLLFFTNNETVTIKLYSDDLRTNVVAKSNIVKQNKSDYTEYSVMLQGQKIQRTRAIAKNITISIQSDGTTRFVKKELNLDGKQLQSMR